MNNVLQPCSLGKIFHFVAFISVDKTVYKSYSIFAIKRVVVDEDVVLLEDDDIGSIMVMMIMIFTLEYPIPPPALPVTKIRMGICRKPKRAFN